MKLERAHFSLIRVINRAYEVIHLRVTAICHAVRLAEGVRCAPLRYPREVHDASDFRRPEGHDSEGTVPSAIT